MPYFGVFLNTQREILPVTHPNEVLEFPYQLIDTSREPRLAEDVKGLIGKILPACSFKEFDFQLKYHGRIYNGSIEDSHAVVEKPEAYPPRVIEGKIKIKLEFPRGDNESNDRLARRLTSDVKPIIPYEKQSPWM
jgi:hypothetical protein